MSEKRASYGSQGRSSKALGAGDPRGHRNVQAGLAPEISIAAPLKFDKRGRLTVTKGSRVDDLSGSSVRTTSPVETALIEKINELLRELRRAGLIEE